MRREQGMRGSLFVYIHIYIYIYRSSTLHE